MTEVGNTESPQDSHRTSDSPEISTGSSREFRSVLARFSRTAPAVVPATRAAAPAVSAPKARSTKKSSALSVAVMALVVPGLFATVALPAYAFTEAPSQAGEQAAAALTQEKTVNAQSVAVADDAPLTAIARDDFTATSAAEIRRAELAVAYASYSGPTAADYLVNPPYPSFSLDQVAAVALQYQGVPYRYGGADPSGFDCSGLVMFVYAQFGISLPHSSASQGAIGTRIAPEAAVPGDLVILDGGGHIGIYLGGGTMIDAPYEGKPVLVRPIYSSDRYFVRIGI